MKILCKILMTSLISLIIMDNLTGCSSMLSSQMPSGSSPMEQTYNDAINGTDNTDNSLENASLQQLRMTGQPLTKMRPNKSKDTRIVENKMNSQFPLLPNPGIVMYVYPHEAGKGEAIVPVPGYSTVFPLYAENHYVMPGDAAING